MQRALELPALPTSQAAERKVPIDGSDYLVRLLELPIEELDIDDDDTINWPDTIEDKMMPRVDGAIALYDVQDKDSIEELPQVLSEWLLFLRGHFKIYNRRTDCAVFDRRHRQRGGTHTPSLLQVRYAAIRA